MNRWMVVTLLALVGLVVSTHAWEYDGEFELEFDLQSMATWALEAADRGKLQRDVHGEPTCHMPDGSPRPCEGPVQAIWGNGECKGRPIGVSELYGAGANFSTCNYGTLLATSFIREYNETKATLTRFAGLGCTGEVLTVETYYYKQCLTNGGGYSFAYLYAPNDTQNILPPPRMDGRAKDAPPAPALSGAPCIPNVNCTTDFIKVAQTSSGYCKGPFTEAGTNFELSSGVCYQIRGATPELNVRWSCYNSEIMQEFFAYGCDGTPLWSQSTEVDKSASTASLAVQKCIPLEAPHLLACRNPVDKPIPSPPTSPVVCPAPTGNSASNSPALFLLGIAAFVSLVML